MYYSQYNQDKILNEKYFKNKQNGTFVDIGAHDGVTLSNTYFFENELGWSGICFEPIPSVFDILSKNRKCDLINGCAWTDNSVKTFRLIEGYSEMLSGLVNAYNSTHINRIDNECMIYGSKYTDIEVKCFNTNEVLKNLNIKNIDLMSLDTEGSELDILKSIDFDFFDINYILVEDNYDSQELMSFMSSKGYDMVERISIDKLFKKK